MRRTVLLAVTALVFAAVPSAAQQPSAPGVASATSARSACDGGSGFGVGGLACDGGG